MSLKKIIMCGGDVRSIYMADFFVRHGINVKMFAPDDEILKKYTFKPALLSDVKDADAVVFGLPAVKNDMNISFPLSDICIGFEDVLKEAGGNAVFAGGRFIDGARKMADEYKVKLIDYSTDEVFQIENAFYTAEGAVETIIKNTVKSLGELKILITGYGRISKALCKIISSFGSQITVFARKQEQRIWAEKMGFTSISSLNKLDKYDVIVNTVPYELFLENELSEMKEDVLLIDLSARPGYIEKKLCEQFNIKLIFLPGIPAVSAPCSAGETAARAVIRMLNEL